MSRTRLASLHYLTSILSTLASLIATMLATRIVLRSLGDDAFGAYRVAAEWLAYVALLDFGLGSALYPIFARAASSSDPEEDEEKALSTSLRAYLVVLAFMLVGTAGLLFALPHVVHTSASITDELRRGSRFALLGLLVVPLTPFRAMLEARQRGYRVNLAAMVQVLATAGLSIAAARAGFGLVGQFGAIAITQMTIPLLLAIDATRSRPELLRRAIARAADPSLWKELWGLNWRMLIIQAAARLSVMSDAILVGYFWGPTFVVPLTLTQRAPSIAQSQILTIGNATWAGLADLYARKDGAFEHRFLEISKLCAIIAIALLCPLVVFNSGVVSLWVGADKFAGPAVNALMALNAFLQGLFGLWLWTFTGTNKIRAAVPLYVLSALVNVTASVVLTRHFGVLGPVLGTFIASSTVGLTYFPYLLRRTFGIRRTKLFAAVLPPLLVGSLYSGALWYVLRDRVPDSWLILLPEMGFVTLGFLALSYVALFDRSGRAAIRSRVHLAIARRAS